MKYIFNERLQFDWKIVTVTIVSTTLLILDRYHEFTGYKPWDRVILYLLIPLLVILFVFRESPARYGFSFGDWKAGLLITFSACALMTPVILQLGQQNDAMRSYYSPYLIGQPWTTFLDLIGWEFFFRGWILFSYLRRFGHDALWLQAVPFAIAHIPKPEVETLSTIFGGFIFGWVAYRTKSFLWPFLIHWYIGTLIVLAASGFYG